ncbi:uncharacterized protein LOC143559301 [Bidens hawaiensis]|uniref:uncharacterized protein LOC143559301 n=1 Tax=Bidens hawaiensis TaxID=980011 RepID=UPI00404B4016
MGNVRDWMYLPRQLLKFEAGVIDFLNASFAKAAKGSQICCPCKRCKNCYWNRIDEVFDHLKGHGFVEDYCVWVFHGEKPSQTISNVGIDDNVEVMHDDRFRDTLKETSMVQEGLNEDASKFYKLVEDGKEEFTRPFTGLVMVNPEGKLPASFTQAKKVIRGLGLDYKKIHACPKDCMLYWKEYKDVEVCHIFHTSRWKQQENEKQQNKNNSEPSKTSSKVLAKVVWHFPLKPRLESLFMSSETAKHMTWHDEGRPKDGNLRHPADGESQKEFDSLYPHFAKEIRNVRLGLSSDGFNPFGTMSIARSMACGVG